MDARFKAKFKQSDNLTSELQEEVNLQAQFNTTENLQATFTDEEQLHAQFEDEKQLKADFGVAHIIPTDNYDDLYNKPSINEVALKGNKTFEELGDHTLTNFEIKALFDRVFGG